MSAGRSILGRISWQVEGVRFVLRNLRASAHLVDSEVASCGEVTLRGGSPADVAAVDRLHRKLRDGERLSNWRKILYGLRGKRLLFVALGRGDALVGFEMFYFKADEVQQKVVHEAFVGIEESWRGKGIATELRRHAARQFAKASVKAISSNVPRDNDASLKSALAAGFDVDHGASTADAFYLHLALSTTDEWSR